jgi:hypothetical protein
MGCAGYGWLFMHQTPKIISPLLSAGDALQLEFNAHVCAGYSRPENPREDANQPALRIVREATER